MNVNVVGHKVLTAGDIQVVLGLAFIEATRQGLLVYQTCEQAQIEMVSVGLTATLCWEVRFYEPVGRTMHEEHVIRLSEIAVFNAIRDSR